jgi:hypothetical protein
MPKEPGEPKLEGEKQDYHFEMMAEMEPAMISLVHQLKTKIEIGSYDALVSDEIGGRLPTLVLRKIMRERCPSRKVETYFLSAGQNYLRDKKKDHKNFDKIATYLRGLSEPNRNVLVVSEYVFHGKTLKTIAELFMDLGINNFDFASAFNAFNGEDEIIRGELRGISGSELFIGGNNYKAHISQEHEAMSGVRKRRDEYLPYPETVLNHIKKHGREFTEQEIHEIFGITGEETTTQEITAKYTDPEKNKIYDERKAEPLSEVEIAEIKEKIKLAREDVATMAQRVIEQVWK